MSSGHHDGVVRGVVLAAGQGTRMKSDLPKVLHEIAGQGLVGWVLAALREAGVSETVCVVGHGAEQVAATVPEGVLTVVQEEQLGTAHATQVGLTAIDIRPDDVIVVVPGDMPLLQAETVRALVDAHTAADAAATMLSVDLDDPSGYGRVLREGGRVVGVVEHKDATAEQLAVTEVATGVYAFSGAVLGKYLEQVRPDNSQGEYYLPDVIGLLAEAGASLESVRAAAEEGLGVNSMDQLAAAAEVIRQRTNQQLMADGVWMLDPARVYVDAGVTVAAGARLYPGVHLEGATSVGEGAVVGPEVHVTDSVIGPGVHLRYAVVVASEIGPGATIGPFAYLRMGVVVRERAKVGTFVEMKNTTLGAGSKVPHLSYMGDATIGERSNVGAGAITCNWDGVDKHPTIIGDDAFVGSDTMLVAPIEVADRGWTAAGSVITHDVPEGSLAVERSPQREIRGYADRRQRRARKATEDLDS